jgi:hypothetical protein
MSMGSMCLLACLYGMGMCLCIGMCIGTSLSIVGGLVFLFLCGREAWVWGSGEFSPLSWRIVFISGKRRGVPKMGVIYPLEAGLRRGARIVQGIGAERVVPRGEMGEIGARFERFGAVPRGEMRGGVKRDI